jgi:histidinol-phosphate aminotransferase
MNKKFNIDSLIRTNVAAMKPYSSARDEFTKFDQEMIFLDANENPFEIGVNRYPDPQQGTLKSLIATQKGLRTSQILLGNGSDEVLDLIFRAFCNPGKDNVISLPPTYGMYKVLSETNDIENREVLLNADFQPDVVEILKRVDARTKLIFLCSPNNPTGNLIEPLKIEEILNGFAGLVVIDEAYIDFAQAPSWATRLSEFPNLLVTQTLSKAYGMAGIRLGMCFASNDVVQILNKIKPPYNVNGLTQAKAFDRMQYIEGVISEITSIINSREELLKALLQVSFIVEIYPSDANFLLIKVDDATQRYNQLLTAGIVVRNRSTQPLCANTLRLTVGTIHENKTLINVLQTLV